jgi:uncharacterized protein YfiM (DUF2279 family)
MLLPFRRHLSRVVLAAASLGAAVSLSLWVAPAASAPAAAAAAAADTISGTLTLQVIKPRAGGGGTPFFLPLRSEGAWLASDRQLHFGACLAVAASLRVEGRPRAQSAAGALAVGVAKEIYDATLKPRHLGRGASRKDLAADLAGAVAGVLLIAAVDR